MTRSTPNISLGVHPTIATENTQVHRGLGKYLHWHALDLITLGVQALLNAVGVGVAVAGKGFPERNW
jgi:hypothetical protein